MRMHALPPSVDDVPTPERFTYPFCYEPHALCVAAAEELRAYLVSQPQWKQELQRGKMFGVLVVSKGDERGFLAAFSGTLDGKTQHAYFVPPVFDLMEEGCYFQEEQERISALNDRIAHLTASLKPSLLREQMEAELRAFRNQMQQDKESRRLLRATLTPEELAVREPEMVRQSQFQKAELRRMQKAWESKIEEDEAPLREQQLQIESLKEERHHRSIELQQWLFRQFVFLNANGQKMNLLDMFHSFAPPSGAGECCAPRLLQYAYKNCLKPLCMAEFWVGESPADELRQDGHYYPACNSRCKPILTHMLQGLTVDDNPLLSETEKHLDVIFQDERMAVIFKPNGMLSVPGKDGLPSVQSIVREMFPHATGPMIVHRLDMDTSGLMVVALTDAAYHQLQDDFLHHRIRKTYRALLENPMTIGESGEIRLPMRPDVMDRPRQMVDYQHGRKAVSFYKVLDNIDGHALVELQPETGRTHQLRVHCAHAQGLNNPIVGDRLYGIAGSHLHLQAYKIEQEGVEYALPPHYESFIRSNV